MSSVTSSISSLISSIFDVFRSIFATIVSALDSVVSIFTNLVRSVFDLMSGLVGFVLGELQPSALCFPIVISFQLPLRTWSNSRSEEKLQNAIFYRKKKEEENTTRLNTAGILTKHDRARRAMNKTKTMITSKKRTMLTCGITRDKCREHCHHRYPHRSLCGLFSLQTEKPGWGHHEEACLENKNPLTSANTTQILPPFFFQPTFLRPFRFFLLPPPFLLAMIPNPIPTQQGLARRTFSTISRPYPSFLTLIAGL